MHKMHGGEGGLILNLGAPQPKQREFLSAQTRFVGYGGARGGGKSWAVQFKASVMALAYAGIRQLILRRTYPELLENHIRPMQASLAGVARYKDSEKAMFFPNGSIIKFGYCDSDADVVQYQGQQYHILYFDEATNFTELQFRTICACVRGVDDYPRRVYCTCNPGGVGHRWVKRLFVDRDYQGDEKPEDYTFIQAGVRDNEILMAKDPDYVRMLEALPLDLRRAWLDGDWNALSETAYFDEIRDAIHVVEPFDIPSYWRRYRAIDYGLDALACVWVAVSETGDAVVYRAIKQPGLIVSAAAKAILDAEGEGEKIEETYFPPDMRSRTRDSGKSQLELFADGGIRGAVASNARIAGWLALKEWLRPLPKPDGEWLTARLRIFSSCRNLVRDLTDLQHDLHNPTDAATEPHEITHLPDALRYFAVMHQRSAVMPETQEQRRARELEEYKRRAIGGNRRARMV